MSAVSSSLLIGRKMPTDLNPPKSWLKHPIAGPAAKCIGKAVPLWRIIGVGGSLSRSWLLVHKRPRIETAIRPLLIGSNIFLFRDSVNGARASAEICSLLNII